MNGVYYHAEMLIIKIVAVMVEAPGGAKLDLTARRSSKPALNIKKLK